MSATISRAHLKLGKRPPRHDARTLHLSDYLKPAAFPKAPAKVDYTKAITKWPIGMLLNDELGDCTIAGALHFRQVVTANTKGAACFTPTDAQVLEGYERICGYDPSQGKENNPTDNGGDLLTVLNSWRKDGIGGEKILAFAKVNLRAANDLKAAIDIFGGLYAGVGLPLSAQDQKIWDVAKGKNGQIYSWGGHCVPVHYYDSRQVQCVTWGTKQPMTWAFFHKYFDEGYVVLTDEWLNAQGKTPDGFDLDTLRADLAKVI